MTPYWSDKTCQQKLKILFGPNMDGRTNYMLLLQYNLWPGVQMTLNKSEDDDRQVQKGFEPDFNKVSSAFESLSPLHYAAAFGLTDLCRWLLESDCDASSQSPFGPPVHLAVTGNLICSEIANNYVLEEKKIKHKKKSSSLTTSKWLEWNYPKTTDSAYREILEVLIEHGVDPRAQSQGLHHCSALELAAAISPIAFVDFLDLGVAVDMASLYILSTEKNMTKAASLKYDDEAMYPLCLILKAIAKRALTLGDEERVLVAKLEGIAAAVVAQISSITPVQHKDSINDLLYKDEYHALKSLRTALDSDQNQIVEYVMNRLNINLNKAIEPKGFKSANITKKCLIHVLAERGQSITIEILLNFGIDINKQTAEGCSPIHYAAMDKSGRSAEILLKNGAKPDNVDPEGWTPWHYASAYSNYKMIEALARHATNATGGLTRRTNLGLAPLHLLCASMRFSKKSTPRTCERLLDSDADVSLLTPDGSTAVHC